MSSSLSEKVIRFFKIESGREPLIQSSFGRLAVWILFVVNSLAFIILVDRQPSPTEEALSEAKPAEEPPKIGEQPGFTVGSPEELLPMGSGPDLLLVLGVVALAGAIYYLFIIRIKSRKSHSESLRLGFLSGVYYLIFHVALLPTLYTWYPQGESIQIQDIYLLVLLLLFQSALFALIVGLYAKPLFPDIVFTEYGVDSGEFDRHMTRSWKFTQMGLSGGVAVAVGASLPILVGKTNLTLLNTFLTVGFLLTSAFAALAFSALQIYYAGKYRRESLDWQNT